MDDHDLMAALAAGDDTALKELFQRHAPWVAGRLRQRLPAGTVEDVLQETFVAVWRNARQYRSEAEVGAWIWGIARRQVAQWLRKEAALKGAIWKEEREVVWQARQTSDPATMGSMRIDLKQALQVLEEDEEALTLAQLALVEERSMSEIADHFEIPVGTVKSRLYQLRQILQASLRKGGY